jgi:hypothetical protein
MTFQPLGHTGFGFPVGIQTTCAIDLAPGRFQVALSSNPLQLASLKRKPTLCKATLAGWLNHQPRPTQNRLVSLRHPGQGNPLPPLRLEHSKYSSASKLKQYNFGWAASEGACTHHNMGCGRDAHSLPNDVLRISLWTSTCSSSCAQWHLASMSYSLKLEPQSSLGP